MGERLKRLTRLYPDNLVFNQEYRRQKSLLEDKPSSLPGKPGAVGEPASTVEPGYPSHVARRSRAAIQPF